MENKIKSKEEILKNKFVNHTFVNLTAKEEEIMLEAMEEYHSQFTPTATDEKEIDLIELISYTELMIDDARVKAYTEAVSENDAFKNAFFRGCEQTLMYYRDKLETFKASQSVQSRVVNVGDEQLKSIKRFYIYYGQPSGTFRSREDMCYDLDENGEWVKWDDVESILSKLSQKSEKLVDGSPYWVIEQQVNGQNLYWTGIDPNSREAEDGALVFVPDIHKAYKSSKQHLQEYLEQGIVQGGIEEHIDIDYLNKSEKDMDEFAVGFNAFVITNYIKKYEGYILRMGSIDAKPKSITELLTTYKESITVKK